MTLINARLSYADERGWTVALFATNLLDETYIVSGAADPRRLRRRRGQCRPAAALGRLAGSAR
ncbi:MAG: hypothetical protein ACXWU1_08275 [Allosphingosinicella sp.]